MQKEQSGWWSHHFQQFPAPSHKSKFISHFTQKFIFYSKILLRIFWIKPRLFFLQNWNILIKRLCVGPDDPQFKTSIWDYWSTGIHITIIIKTFETKFPPRYGLSQETWVLQMLKNLETEITGRLLSYSHRHGAAG